MWDESEAELLKANERAYRQWHRRYIAHPDCQDPDHPGCEACHDYKESADETEE